ncbi:hypothetical protein ACEPPN_017700 [Leptodophora sp. 'Broadleaf-Isolate-01']
MFTTHINDLSSIDYLKRRVDKLEGECNEKDKAVKSYATTINTLKAIDHEAKAGIEDQLKQIAKEREELKEERTKLRRRVEVVIAEEQYIIQRNFEERVARHDEAHETRIKELEVESAQKIDEVNTRVVALEAEKTRVLATAEQQEKKLKAQADELDELKEKYDSLNRVKDSFKREKEDLEKELEMIKKEFALDNKTAAYLRREEAHKRLIVEDPCFKSVLIDDSEDSSDLCAAYAQRIISAVVYDDVWKPLRSELTFQNPDFGTFLVKISDALDKTGQHGRTANVWTALTMRALQAVDAEAAIASIPESEQNIRSLGYNRANSVVSKVVRVLGPLVSVPRIESLKTDLLAVVNSSVDV